MELLLRLAYILRSFGAIDIKEQLNIGTRFKSIHCIQKEHRQGNLS